MISWNYIKDIKERKNFFNKIHKSTKLYLTELKQKHSVSWDAVNKDNSQLLRKDHCNVYNYKKISIYAIKNSYKPIKLKHNIKYR